MTFYMYIYYLTMYEDIEVLLYQFSRLLSNDRVTQYIGNSIEEKDNLEMLANIALWDRLTQKLGDK